MKLNSRTLARRDPAFAALMGGISGADFGRERASFGDDYGSDDDDVGGFGDDDAGFGDDDVGAAPRRRPTAQQALAAHSRQANARHRAQKRRAMLDPNMGSDVAIERYSFSLSQNFTLGTEAQFGTAFSGTSDTKFRPQIITINAPCPGFAYISSIRMANVNVTVGSGEEDAFNYSAGGQLRQLDMPTLSPSNRATITGRMTAFVPPGYLFGATYTLGVNFKGWSLLAAGG
jgi:hypothetical protein